MNSENEKLRGLLQQARDMLEEQALHIEAEVQPAGKKLLNQIRAALSQQPEPTDTYTAVDMATAAAQGFRDGQAAEQAPAQDEQQPTLWARQCDLDEPDPAIFVAREQVEKSGYVVPFYAAPIAQTAPQDTVAVLEVWDAIGHDTGCNPGKDELLASLRHMAELATSEAALQPEQSGWIGVEDQLPESERTVLAYYLNSHGKGRRVRAEYIAAKTKSADDGWDSDEPADYDEQADEYFWPAGWYEVMDNWDDLTHMVIHEGEVTHWIPLPSPPTP